MDIKAILIRDVHTSECTLGKFNLMVNGQLVFAAYTCEDVCRPVKVKGETAIPPGIYMCAYTPSNRFPPRKWELLDVPDFRGIRIHAGNTAKDTDGCILLGMSRSENENRVNDSRAAVQEFERIMQTYNNQEFVIEVC